MIYFDFLQFRLAFLGLIILKQGLAVPLRYFLPLPPNSFYLLKRAIFKHFLEKQLKISGLLFASELSFWPI